MTHKILIPLSVAKKSAKQIKKLNSHLNHTQSLNFVAHFLGFDDFNDFESRFKHNEQNKSYNFNSMDEMNIYELETLKESFNNYSNTKGITLPETTFVDTQLHFQINNIDKMEALCPSGWLYLLPYRVHQDKRCFCPETWKLDEDKLFELIDEWVKLYINDNDIRESRYDFKNQDEEEEFFEGRILQFLWFYHHDGVYEKMIKFVKDELEYEKDFLRKLNARGNIKFTLPVFVVNDKKESYLRELTYIKNNTSLQSPLLLGKTLKSSWFEREKTLKLTKNEILENVLISGVAGSGKTVSTYAYMKQALMNNSGFIYCSLKGTPTDLFQIKEMAKEHNRSEDVIVFTFTHLNEMKHIDFSKLIQKNKIVVLLIFALEKTPDITVPVVIKSVIEPIKEGIKAQRKKSRQSYFPYLLFIEEGLEYLVQPPNNPLDDEFFSQAFKNNVAIIANVQQLSTFPLEVLNKFRHYLLFKQLKSIDKKWFQDYKHQLLSLRPGWFMYFNRSLNEIDNVAYVAPFLNYDELPPIYLSYYKCWIN